MKRRRFTVAYVYYNWELCDGVNQTAGLVLHTLAHRRKIKGWPDRGHFDECLVEWMGKAKRVDHFMVGGLAMVVRAK